MNKWLRNLIVIGGSFGLAAIAARRQIQGQPTHEALTSSSNFRPVAPVESSPVSEQPTTTETVVDVTEPHIVGKYVLSEEPQIGENDEIDLALEEEFERDDPEDELDGDDEAWHRLGDDDAEDEVFEGVLGVAASDQVLEPSAAVEERRWVEPVDGECPEGYPVKARFSTGRYHEPGDRGYEKIAPDCCYATVDEAEADGFTHSRWS